MTKFLIAALGGLLLLSPVMAEAQGRNCAPREHVVTRLAVKYGETRQSIGMGQQGMVLETWASNDTGSWTITVTTPNGMTCLVASGQNYENLSEALPKQESSL